MDDEAASCPAAAAVRMQAAFGVRLTATRELVQRCGRAGGDLPECAGCVPAESVVGEDFVEARGVDHPVGPGFQLLGFGAGETVEHVLRKRTEAAGEQAAQNGAFALHDALLHIALDCEPFDAGHVSHFPFSFNAFDAHQFVDGAPAESEPVKKSAARVSWCAC